jgi:HSP20 family protein
MASIVRWEPFRGPMTLRQARDMLDRLFDEDAGRWPGWLPNWLEGNLALDVYETDDAVVIKTAIPGVNPEEIDISVSGDTLTISAETKEGEEVKRENYIRRERRYGSCCRSVTLPGGLEADKAEAKYENGVLTLTIPKAEEVKPKTITVKTS